jgi:hypothetical protein
LVSKASLYLLVDDAKLPVEEFSLKGCRLSWAPDALLAQKWAVADFVFVLPEVEVKVKGLRISLKEERPYGASVIFHDLTSNQREMLKKLLSYDENREKRSILDLFEFAYPLAVGALALALLKG